MGDGSESFKDELKVPEKENEVFVDAVEEPPRELRFEGAVSAALHPECPSIRPWFESIVSTVLHFEPESCSIDSITTYMPNARKYYAVRRDTRRISTMKNYVYNSKTCRKAPQ